MISKLNIIKIMVEIAGVVINYLWNKRHAHPLREPNRP